MFAGAGGVTGAATGEGAGGVYPVNPALLRTSGAPIVDGVEFPPILRLARVSAVPVIPVEPTAGVVGTIGAIGV